MALTGCGSSGGGTVVQTGTFVDSPVAGLNYRGPTTIAGITNAAGQFSYTAGDTITFSIGNLVLGSAAGAGTVTPQSITAGASSSSDQRVNNKLILLQTLDADGDLNNGIQITEAIRMIVSANAGLINFDQSTTAFRTSLTDVLAALNAAQVFSSDTDPRPRTARGAQAALEHFARSTSVRHVVTTTYGQVSGYEANASTWQYLGIPYAKPPIGELRWRPPQSPTAWTGVRDAIAWSDQAAQMLAMEAFGEGAMSEDCLYLNVTAPKNASNYPVMVWFHGGAFTLLTANSKQYNNPDGLTNKGVVLVTVNHRLGPFGYIAHPLLTAESGYNGSGNYGQMDLVMALTWVKNNIANFGGDPNNVTIFGQSGGGGKVFGLMMSPQAAGLFHKAICQSGANVISSTGTVATSLAGMEAVGSGVFQRAGVTTLADARALPWTAIIQAETANNIPREIYRPNSDNYYLPKTYYQTMLDGMPSDVPFMVGCTSGDYASLRAGLPTFMTQRTPYYNSNQFVYRFDRLPDGWVDLGLLSVHGFELPYLFNYPLSLVQNYKLGIVVKPDGTKPPIADLNGNGITGTAGDEEDIYASMRWSAVDDAVSETMMTMWTNFAKTGNPSITGLAWPAYTLANDTYMDISPTPTVKTGLATAYQ